MTRKYENCSLSQAEFYNLAAKQKPVQTLYNILVNTAEKILPVSSFFSEKMKLFVEGRKGVFKTLEESLTGKEKTIWIHAASLGEYEQAVPVIEKLREIYPAHKIIVTFFSPSGYEVKKNSSLADVVTYLPLDTPKNASKFLDLIHPEWALFIKYEFWPNYLAELKKRKIKSLLISGNFREDQLFFKPYGKWMLSYLKTFQHFFVQNRSSKELLRSAGFSNVSISGDTRFDRVARQIEQNNELGFIKEFKAGKLCVVAGSTWPEDEELMLDHINKSSENKKFIIAPHALKPAKIKELQNKLIPETVLFSEKEGKDLSKYRVFIIDTIGLLSKIYSYADIAYVGGAAGDTGLHNILEPATFGVPVIIGKNFSRFPEAVKLQQLSGLFSVRNREEFAAVLSKLEQDEQFRNKTGMITEHFINSNTGATKIIADYLRESHAATD